MISVAIKPIQYIQQRFKNEIDQQRINAIAELRKLLLEADSLAKPYLKRVIELFEDRTDILTTIPADLTTFEILVAPVTLGIVKVTGKRTGVLKSVPVKDAIIKALGYKALRTSFYPGYFAAVGIKACVYCNSQLTVSVGNAKDGFSAMFDVDHNLSKDRYPWLSICLFNLYPACASCNRRKSKNPVNFELYSDDIRRLSQSDFSFKIDEYAKAKYLISKNPMHLKSEFLGTVPDFDTFKKTFAIDQIYGTQLDVIEELIIKSQMYDPTYRVVLARSFSKLGINSSIFRRIILGNYANPSEIHKRPMSKFMQDIAMEIGLI